MSRRGFRQVDVFTSVPLLGNPVAVVLDAEGLSTEQMQEFCHWTNLSEATFVLPPEDPRADYAVRIFCPGRELPFAGHPTLGTCHAWLEAGGQPKDEVIVQECGVGLVSIRRTDRLAFAAPALLRSGPLEDPDRVAAALGLDPSEVIAHAWCDNGPGWQAVLVESAERVLEVRPDPVLASGLDLGVVGPHPAGSPVALEVRAFFPGASGQVVEDPVTGSLQAALAQWLIGAGLMPDRYVAAQGTVLGRAGRVHVERLGEDIWIGGSSVTVLAGEAVIDGAAES